MYYDDVYKSDFYLNECDYFQIENIRTLDYNYMHHWYLIN